MESVPTKHDDNFLRLALAAVILLALIGLGILEENWRGKHDWNKLKQQLEAHGGHVDWTNYIPVPVPNDQNVFGAPKMTRWFTGRGGRDLSSRLATARENFLTQVGSDVIARVTVVKRWDPIAPEDADIVLDYNADLATVSLQQPDSSKPTGHAVENIPLIIMNNVPLSDAVKHLARAAKINYATQPEIRDPSGREPALSLRWTNVTAKRALGAVLKTYNLRLLPNSKTGIGRIVDKHDSEPDIYSEPGVEQRLRSLMETAIAARSDGYPEHASHTAAGITLVQGQLNPITPIRVVVRAEELPTTNNVADFFPKLTNAYYPWIVIRARVESTGSNTFTARLNQVTDITTAGYLSWSDGFAEDFGVIREALKSPYAQMNGDYRDPVNIPIPNFITHRVVAQTLTDRAKCHLLLGQPDAALQDLELVRGLCRVIEGWPGKKPTTLSATMLDSAITGLYVQTIADGMRLHAWREPELAALQKQLKQIDLVPMLAKSFEFERASCCRILETVKPDKFLTSVKLSRPTSPATNLWALLKNRDYLLLKAGPRGWVYQNMSKIALLDEKLLAGFDTTNRLISPRKTEGAHQETLTTLNHYSPYSFLLFDMIPSFTRAVQTLSRNQCLAEEALIACALERYHLVHGQYPETLETLVPQFIEKIPHDIIGGQPLKYRRTNDGQFTLYSVGWNEKDDGGSVVKNKENPADVDPNQGDWVWSASAQ